MAAIALGAGAPAALSHAARSHGTLTGKYRTRIKSGSKADPPGIYRLHFTKGHYTASYNGKVLIRGTDVVTGSSLTFSDQTGPCVGTPGNYTYQRTGKTLKFQKVSDSCDARSFVLAHKFTKVK